MIFSGTFKVDLKLRVRIMGGGKAPKHDKMAALADRHAPVSLAGYVMG